MASLAEEPLVVLLGASPVVGELPFEERVVTGNRDYFQEMVKKSGQTLAPVVDIDGHLLIDTDADAVEAYLDRTAA